MRAVYNTVFRSYSKFVSSRLADSYYQFRITLLVPTLFDEIEVKTACPKTFPKGEQITDRGSTFRA